ncbi:PREDICTED: aryl hydrocarbon receptor nuclear translocator-like protein 1 isoform X2 [Vollenhovia emeryi]|uniref:aryl hydrocarbon receptor nuclear translocator-like protein 1 isoform X2 n=1 Tax=Vollenhovia emeryi TaxID=411798 RepID=UPI0005F3B93B|nr:PREDICTED: aryl hydrocarbon receptor nuclear translocator-like protein 1 isoform X2 [Vollenhovia emeryi]
MYALLDEGSLLPDTSSDGVVENDDAVVAASDGACVNDRMLHYHQHQHQQHPHQPQQRHHHRQLQQPQQHPSAESELDDLLRFRGTATTTGQGQEEMVAQGMAQGYTQLLHSAAAVPAQETQEYISLEELQPRIHHQEHHRAVHDTCTQLATSASQLYHQHHQHQQQQRSGGGQQQQQQHQRDYYNLSSVQSSCSTVYFGEIGTGSGVGELTTASAGGGGEGLAPTPTPASSSSSGSTASTTTTPSSPSTTATATTTTTSTSTTATIPQVATGAEPPQHMETPPTMVPDQQAPASGHHYHHHHHHHHHHHRHHRSTSTTPSHGPATDTSDEFAPVSRKRKLSCHVGSDLLDDLGDDTKSVRTNDDSKKQNHSEIEKRRRDKMNTYITELSAMVPMCHAMSRKLDKLTVLRMAVQHLKTILGAVTSYTEGHYKPAFLSDQELKTLILQLVLFQAAEGFVFVVGCDRGRILYVSESVSQTLNYSQGDLLGQSWFDILHPKDVAKVKEQLSSSDLSPRERLIDAKTMLPVKTDVPQGVSRLCPGARRSFFCRMKRKVDGIRCGEMQVKEEADTAAGCHRRKKQQNCTGYLKSWAPAKIGLEEQEGEADGEACNLSCLVAVGRVQTAISTTALPSRKPHSRPIQFVSRHAIDGKFLFVDQRATPVLGFLPQELLGTSMYEYYHHHDIPHLAESHKAALQTSERVTTQIYRFRSKGGNFVRLQSEWKSFRNPWTKDIEYLIAKNSAIFCDVRSGGNNRSEDSSVQGNYDYFTQSNGGLERLISSHVEVSKIGRQIAEEVLDSQRRGEDSSSGSSPGPAAETGLLNTESQITTMASPERIPDVSQPGGIGSDNSSSNPTSTTFNHVANNVQLNSIANDQGASPDDDMMDMIGGTAISESPNPIPSDGNDEAAMAVIMSLLEADAGLGGPVDFSGLPWPLP